MFLLVFILLLGFALRFYNLGTESIWLDEASSLKNSITEQKDTGHPPIYYLILGYWVNSFGSSEFSLRFPSLIFGVLSVLTLYYVVKTIFNKNVALLSSFLMSISLFQIVYSQEARSYTLLSLLTLLSVLFFVRIIKRDKKKDYFFYALILILVNYTHYLAILLVIVYNFIFYFLVNFKQKRWFITNLIIIILLSPLFYALSLNLLRLYSDFRNLSYLAGISYNMFHLLSIIGGIVLFVIFVIFLFWSYKKKCKIRELLKNLSGLVNKFISKKQGLYLFFLFLIFIIWLIIYINFLDFLMSPYGQFVVRYSFFIAPLFYVLIAIAISKIKARDVTLFFILLFAVISGFSLCVYYASITKEEWNHAAAFLEENVGENEVILVDASYMIGPLEYYLEKYNRNIRRIPLLSSTNQEQTASNFTGTLPKLLSTQGQWLILSHNWRSKDFYKLQMDARFNLIQEKHYKDIDIYYYSGQRNENQINNNDN